MALVAEIRQAEPGERTALGGFHRRSEALRLLLTEGTGRPFGPPV
jgi:hypothetical protein